MTSGAGQLRFKRGGDWVGVSNFLKMGFLICEPAPEALRTFLPGTAGAHKLTLNGSDWQDFESPAEMALRLAPNWPGLHANDAISTTKRYFTSLFSMRS
jgi:hypothetical protein